MNLNRHKMVYIYALMSGQLVLYVGQTIQKLKDREYTHRCKGNTTSSKHIPEYIDWTMELLEECDDASKRMREQYYYDTLKPLYNTNRPGQTRYENWRRYYQNNRDKRNETQRRYRQKKKAKAKIPSIILQEAKLKALDPK